MSDDYRIVVVDDLRTFVFPAEYHRTSAAALEALKALSSPLRQLWLDFDLGIVDGTIDTAEPVADFLCELAFDGRPLPVDIIVIHSANPVGAERMERSLARWGYTTRRVDAETYL